MLPTILYECSEFLVLSEGQPLLRNLPKRHDGFIKVKVRQKRMSDSFIENFNGAFSAERTNLLQRSVFVRGEATFKTSTDPALEPFYVFPIDGFRFMYNPLASSTLEYKNTFDTLLANVGESAPEIFQKVLRTDYLFDKLDEGISGGSEIILFGISHYYALRKSIIDEAYEKFLLS